MAGRKRLNPRSALRNMALKLVLEKFAGSKGGLLRVREGWTGLAIEMVKTLHFQFPGARLDGFYPGADSLPCVFIHFNDEMYAADGTISSKGSRRTLWWLIKSYRQKAENVCFECGHVGLLEEGRCRLCRVEGHLRSKRIRQSWRS